jgi:hypothetical protein
MKSYFLKREHFLYILPVCSKPADPVLWRPLTWPSAASEDMVLLRLCSLGPGDTADMIDVLEGDRLREPVISM